MTIYRAPAMKAGRKPIGGRAMTAAERQARYRAKLEQKRRAQDAFIRHYIRRSRRHRWKEAVAELVDLRLQYIAWLKKRPPSLENSRTSEMLRKIEALDLDSVAQIELPRGFGHLSSS
jgi:hypothetical protein